MMEMLSYPFMQNALLMGVILGALFSLIGVFIVSKGMSFYGDFVAHSAILGSALAVLVGTDTSLFLIPYTIIVGILVSTTWNLFPISRDTVLGVFYGGFVSLGMLLISAKSMSENYVMQFLFGDILLIGASDIIIAGLLLTAFCLFLVFGLKQLVRATFLPDISMAEGINVRLYDYILVGFVSLCIALSIKLVGVMLANAMVVIPAASAKTLSRSFRQFIILAPVIGIFSFLTGIAGSFYFNLPSGPAVIAVSFSIFACASIFKSIKS